MGMTILGSYRADMTTGGVKVPSSGNEPVSVRFSVLQKLAEDFFVEPSVTLGLTNDAPNSVISLNYQVYVLARSRVLGAHEPSDATVPPGRSGGRRGLALACVPLILVLAAGCTSTSKTEKQLIKPMASYQALKFKNVVPQVFDFTCGAASLATLVNGVYGEHYNEAQLLLILRAQFPPAAWKVKQKQGFSFADLAFVAARIGYQAEGAEIGIGELVKVNGPVIVQLNKADGKFQHFTVFRGVKDGLILTADPITGLTSYAPDRFAEEYTGFALAVWKEGTPIPEEYALLVGAKDRRNALRHFGNDLGVRPPSVHTNL